MEGPCGGWVPNTSLCASWAGLSDEQKAYASRVAVLVLWAATGRRFGLCAQTLRPCWQQQAPLYESFPVGYYGEGYWTLLGVAGGVQVLGGCACASGCQCSPPQLALPPVAHSVVDVTIDGVALPAASYQLRGGYLIRMDGQPWPNSQNLGAPLGQPNTWSVTYNQGEQVPLELLDAAGIYACEVGKALTGGTCQLPNRVQSVTRQGVEINYVSVDDYLDKGLTGYDLVDMVIRSVNPNQLQQRPRVLSLDMPTYR